MNEFQAGDLVKCVDNSIYDQLLTVGSVYHVVDSYDEYIDVITNQGRRAQFFNHRFILHKAGENNYKAKYEQLASVVAEFIELMECSRGVAGLHLNGDVADWYWLRHNGWLDNLNKYLGE